MFFFYTELLKDICSLCLILIFLCVLYVKFVSLNKLVSRSKSLSARKNILILTAHPDDECMFFSPTILGLYEDGHRVFIVCFSKGNYYGQGEARKKELLKSCRQLGVIESQVTIIDDSKFPDDPLTEWNRKDLGETILTVIDRIKPHSIITFDSLGVSGHANHKALFHAVRKLCEGGKLSKDICVFTLESTNILRKYISCFDIPWSSIAQTIPTVFVCSPSQLLSAWKAMACHASQMVWFRKLYMIFSRYMLVNTLQEMSPMHHNNNRYS